MMLMEDSRLYIIRFYFMLFITSYNEILIILTLLMQSHEKEMHFAFLTIISPA
jgi:hypothetical protein